MTSGTFSIREAVKAGWRGTSRHFGFWLLSLLLMFFLSNGSTLLALLGYEKIWALIILANLLGVVLQALVLLGLFEAALAVVRGERPAFSMLFENWRLLLKYFGGYFLYSLLVIGGLFLLVVPGVLWALRYQFYVFGIVDLKLGPRGAIRYSGKIARGAELKLLGFVVLAMLINFAGALLIFGLFVTLPFTVVALAHIYQQLAANETKVTASIPSATVPS